MATIIEFLLVMFLMTMAVWRRNWMLYVISGFAWMLYGFTYWTTDHYMSIMIVIIGLFNFVGAKWDRN